MISVERLADVFVSVADTLVDDFDLMDFLHGLTTSVADLTGAAAAGILLTDVRGDLNLLAASSDQARELEYLQLESAEGPCLDGFRTGTQVIEDNLSAAAERWSFFAPRAVDAGFLSVHTFPLRLRDKVIGALDVFGVARGPLLDGDTSAVQALADVATIAIIQERALVRADLLTEQLEFALNSRIAIEQAKGAVARTFGISVDQAFELLRSHARSQRLRLTDLAVAVLNDPSRVDNLRA
ncbi:GAF and ANTAR domain-containing protein [Nocardioides cavernaquae]|uniref:ANTAR domain-containing protein n=1 Tax=Nocardioides cavernaquae TaxID=2321396 RepID=A0A3A5HA90_9ACTN|nr:GAF and ANTAR domain-containing protein [Nocardioides cavernaquae]RJS47556.1 ANTAR domain-containing protein [Nocardioides cavernaquae]